MRIVCLQTIVDAEQNQKDRPAHLQWVFEKQRESKIEAGGRFADGSGGMIIYTVSDFAEAQRLAAEDPIIAGGARSFVLHEWLPIDFEHPESYR
ncbi:MAG: hypothetical protein IMW91_10910 [Firmicutes bacterium]|nr:hypothetical protein [Bacillota bacterium]